jgi:hypothetical protein
MPLATKRALFPLDAASEGGRPNLLDLLQNLAGLIDEPLIMDLLKRFSSNQNHCI